MGGVSYAMMRFRLVDVDEFIIRGIVYLLTVSALALAFFGLVTGLPMLLPADFGPLIHAAPFLAAFLATLLMFLVVPRVHRGVDAFMETRVLNVRGEARRRLREFTGRVSSITDLPCLFNEAVEVAAAAVDAGSVALYARDEYSSDMSLRSTAGPAPSGGRPRTLALEGAALCGVPLADRAVVLYECEEQLAAEDRARLDELRRVHQAELILPVAESGNLHGLLLIGRSRDHRLFGDVDIALLESLALRIALTIRSRQLERQANHAEKLISLGTLAAGVAHELRNPLVSIRTFSALIEEQGGDPEFRREFRSVVARDVERIASIVDNVSAFADNAPVKFTLVRPSEVLRGVRDISAPDFRAAGVELVLPDQDSCQVSGNYSQLLQVFINLFQNALHALDGRPSPSIRVGYRRGPETADGPSLVIDVADNGAGIDEAVRQRIFEPFVTTKSTGDEAAKRGMGLGLAIVKRIVEAHRGTITVASKPGVGTTFSVQLPCLK
ncbi:MAG: ATP-binding protein [Verrucomicrobiota bacterium]